MNVTVICVCYRGQRGAITVPHKCNFYQFKDIASLKFSIDSNASEATRLYLPTKEEVQDANCDPNMLTLDKIVRFRPWRELEEVTLEGNDTVILYSPVAADNSIDSGCLPTSHKRKHSAQVSEPNPHRRFDSHEVILVRTDLIQEVIEIIEAPPCSGKSTLIRQIWDYFYLKKVLTHYVTDWKDISETSTTVNYSPRCNGYTVNPPEGTAYPRLLESILLNNQEELWVILDEVQLTYGDPYFWETIYTRVITSTSNVRVIAAGSYGSHNMGSTSHSPPLIIQPQHRMPLFRLGGHISAHLAFSEQDLDDIMTLHGGWSLDSELRQAIMEYSSPALSGLGVGMHPAVVKELVWFVDEQTRRESVKVLTLLDRFNQYCMSLTGVGGRSLKLGRCIPTLPAHHCGFTPSTLLVFREVLKQGFVEIPFIQPIVTPHIVAAYPVSWKKEANSLVLKYSNVPPEHLVSDPGTRKDDPVIADASCLIKPNLIASTPIQRLREMVPGATSMHNFPKLKLYAHRQFRNSRGILSDFEQAAHDIRRMGWLLQVPSGEEDTIKLVIPTGWHHYYLERLLLPVRASDNAKNLSLDDFCIEVLRRFRRDVLIMHRNSESLYEHVYQSEFMYAARELARDPCFIMPEVRTECGDGIVDFEVPSRRWLIELLREGTAVEEHVNRFDPIEGPYGRQWPDHKWKVLDFRANVMPRKERPWAEFWAVVLDADCNRFEVKTLHGSHFLNLNNYVPS